MGLKLVHSKTQGGKLIPAYDLGFPGRKNCILEHDPLFAMIYGERSDGKSFSGAELILWDYIQNKERGVWIRKDDEAFKDPDVRSLFNPIFTEGVYIDKRGMLCSKEDKGAENLLLTCGWDGVEWRRGAWWLYRYDSTLDKNIYDDNPFCYAKPIRVSEARKGGVMEQVHYCVFDEFLSRNSAYIKDETILFANLVSTIVRYQKHARFILMANTVNKRSEYFKLFHVKPDEVEQGAIHLQKNRKGDYFAVEYIAHADDFEKDSDSYMEFMQGNRIRMIKDGSWEMADYPIMDREYRPKDVKKTFFILLDETCVKCQIIKDNRDYYLYICENDMVIDEEHDLIFSNSHSIRANWFQSIAHTNKFAPIYELIRQQKVLFDTIDSGETFNEYLKFCKTYSIIKA
ncbi:MAG: phage DNA encapsidation protein [Clostridiales bacterium]|nr:phage DNA encapsidation protein [Clostridiales bacterium]MBQ1571183.1 phage DNA encapsidation protein [Clostridiales bacterium]